MHVEFKRDDINGLTSTLALLVQGRRFSLNEKFPDRQEELYEFHVELLGERFKGAEIGVNFLKPPRGRLLAMLVILWSKIVII